MLAEATGAATRSDVLAALHQASAATGSDFNYLLSTAMRESSLRPQAKSSTSSAAGLFQFVDQTWFGLVKQFGAKHGLGSFASAIEREPDGRFHADNVSDRHAILALRNDPKISALMAGEYAQVTRSSLEASLGRGVSNGELYAAHFLGPEAACRLIRMNGSHPEACAATAFPGAAAANYRAFFHTNGTAKTVHEVYDWALKQPSGAAPPAAGATAQAAANFGQGESGELAANPDEWTALQLWAATKPSAGSLVPQAPLAATADILDVLGSLPDPAKLKHSQNG